MLKYPCLVLDHDDTVVQSEISVNYPYFCYILDQFRPGMTITAQEYTKGCFHPGFFEMCRQKYGFSDAELQEEYLGWKEYVKTHIPLPYPGIERIIRRYREAGGILCVVSHSSEENITRDYLTHFGITPDRIFGCDLPAEQCKPFPYPLEQIMAEFQLTPRQLLVVDDLKPAVKMARSVGAGIAFAAWSKNDVPEIVNEMALLCDYTFHTISELESFLFEENDNEN